MKEHFLSLANYNAWANERLYDAAGSLPPEELTRERGGAYFTSLLGTFNHILLADRVWLDRIEGHGEQHVLVEGVGVATHHVQDREPHVPVGVPGRGAEEGFVLFLGAESQGPEDQALASFG